MKNRHLIVNKTKEIAEDFAFELEKIEELKAQCETYFDELPEVGDLVIMPGYVAISHV